MATGCRPNSSPSTPRSSGSGSRRSSQTVTSLSARWSLISSTGKPSAISIPSLYSRVRAWHLVGVTRQIADAATVSGSLPWKVVSLGARVPSWPPNAPSGTAGSVVMRPRISPQLLPRGKRLLDHRVVVGAEHPPVLAFGQDLFRAADRAEVAGAAERRRLLAARQGLGGPQQLPVHPDQRHVGRAQVLPRPVVDGPGGLGRHRVLRPEVHNSAVRRSLLRDPVDVVVVVPGVLARHDPGRLHHRERVLLVGEEQRSAVATGVLRRLRGEVVPVGRVVIGGHHEDLPGAER